MRDFSSRARDLCGHCGVCVQVCQLCRLCCAAPGCSRGAEQSPLQCELFTRGRSAAESPGKSRVRVASVTRSCAGGTLSQLRPLSLSLCAVPLLAQRCCPFPSRAQLGLYLPGSAPAVVPSSCRRGHCPGRADGSPGSLSLWVFLVLREELASLTRSWVCRGVHCIS